MTNYQDVPYYYKDLAIGKFRNYFQQWISTEYNATKITEHIFISDIASVYNKDRLEEDGITHIITTVLGVGPMYPESFVYMNIPARDIENQNMEGYFDECYKFIESGIEKGGKVLVHCAYGVSRSASIVIAYLIKKNGYTYEEAYEKVKKRRNIIEPNEGFKRQLRLYSRMLRE